MLHVSMPMPPPGCPETREAVRFANRFRSYSCLEQKAGTLDLALKVSTIFRCADAPYFAPKPHSRPLNKLAAVVVAEGLTEELGEGAPEETEAFFDLWLSLQRADRLKDWDETSRLIERLKHRRPTTSPFYSLLMGQAAMQESRRPGTDSKRRRSALRRSKDYQWNTIDQLKSDHDPVPLRELLDDPMKSLHNIQTRTFADGPGFLRSCAVGSLLYVQWEDLCLSEGDTVSAQAQARARWLEFVEGLDRQSLLAEVALRGVVQRDPRPLLTLSEAYHGIDRLGEAKQLWEAACVYDQILTTNPAARSFWSNLGAEFTAWAAGLPPPPPRGRRSSSGRLPASTTRS